MSSVCIVWWLVWNKLLLRQITDKRHEDTFKGNMIGEVEGKLQKSHFLHTVHGQFFIVSSGWKYTWQNSRTPQHTMAYIWKKTCSTNTPWSSQCEHNISMALTLLGPDGRLHGVKIKEPVGRLGLHRNTRAAQPTVPDTGKYWAMIDTAVPAGSYTDKALLLTRSYCTIGWTYYHFQ